MYGKVTEKEQAFQCPALTGKSTYLWDWEVAVVGVAHMLWAWPGSSALRESAQDSRVWGLWHIAVWGVWAHTCDPGGQLWLRIWAQWPGAWALENADASPAAEEWAQWELWGGVSTAVRCAIPSEHHSQACVQPQLSQQQEREGGGEKWMS